MKPIMNLIKVSLLAFLLSVSAGATADPAAAQEAEKLLEVTNMEGVLKQSIEQMLDIQIQSAPQLVPYKNIMLEFLEKYMSYENLKPDLIKIYSNAFTASELRELNQFYTTEIGKKSIEKMPMLMAQGAQLGAMKVQQNSAELEAMIKAESERLQKLEQ